MSDLKLKFHKKKDSVQIGKSLFDGYLKYYFVILNSRAIFNFPLLIFNCSSAALYLKKQN